MLLLRTLGAISVFAGGLASAGTAAIVGAAGGPMQSGAITHNSLVPLGVLLAGIGCTAIVTWRAATYLQSLTSRIEHLEKKLVKKP